MWLGDVISGLPKSPVFCGQKGKAPNMSQPFVGHQFKIKKKKKKPKLLSAPSVPHDLVSCGTLNWEAYMPGSFLASKK